MSIGGPELLILLAIVILVFGAGWLPKAAKNLGRAKVELDRTKQQLDDTKAQVIEATGIQQIESTARKANRALNATPQGLLKSATASAMKPSTIAADGGAETGDELIEDAEIVDRSSGGPDVSEPAEVGDSGAAATGSTDTNLTVDFSDD